MSLNTLQAPAEMAELICAAVVVAFVTNTLSNPTVEPVLIQLAWSKMITTHAGVVRPSGTKALSRSKVSNLAVDALSSCGSMLLSLSLPQALGQPVVPAPLPYSVFRCNNSSL